MTAPKRDGRRNSGRKALLPGDKKITVPIYVPAKIVEAVGGKAEAQRIATEAVMNAEPLPA